MTPWAKGLKSGLKLSDHPRRYAQLMLVNWFFVRLVYDNRPKMKHRSIQIRAFNKIVFINWY